MGLKIVFGFIYHIFHIQGTKIFNCYTAHRITVTNILNTRMYKNISIIYAYLNIYHSRDEIFGPLKNSGSISVLENTSSYKI